LFVPATPVDLRAPLSLHGAWRFPLREPEGRKDLLIGAALLLLPIIGWLLNMGHRVQMTHRMQQRETPWPAWGAPGQLLKHGLITAAGMLYYFTPGLLLLWLGRGYLPLAIIAAVLLAAAVCAIPGYMSHYCVRFDAREIFNPFRALGRSLEGGAQYWKAWGIVLCTLAFSFLGLLAAGVGFLVTSVWFWQVAAFCFASVFTQRYRLGL
jgi:hypothetical protein